MRSETNWSSMRLDFKIKRKGRGRKQRRDGEKRRKNRVEKGRAGEEKGEKCPNLTLCRIFPVFFSEESKALR